MLPPVARDLMPSFMAAAHEVRPTHRHPAEEEHGRLGPPPLQEFEELIHRDVDARGNAVPGLLREGRLQVGDLEELLHIEGEGMSRCAGHSGIIVRTRRKASPIGSPIGTSAASAARDGPQHALERVDTRSP